MDCGSAEEFRDRVFGPCREAGIELVVMGGFLKHVLIPADFENRVINIHPSLIPAYCGAGFYGHHVHESVIEAGETVSGCTIHFVDNQYDHGPIIHQRQVAVETGDTPDTLAARVFEAECDAYPEVIRLACLLTTPRTITPVMDVTVSALTQAAARAALRHADDTLGSVATLIEEFEQSGHTLTRFGRNSYHRRVGMPIPDQLFQFLGFLIAQFVTAVNEHRVGFFQLFDNGSV